VLISGHHANVNRWRREQALLRTFQKRPELLENMALDAEDDKFIAQLESTQVCREGDEAVAYM